MDLAFVDNVSIFGGILEANIITAHTLKIPTLF